MNPEQHPLLAGLSELTLSTDVLLAALSVGDEDKAHEAVSVMLMQALHSFGPDSVAFEQFYPVMDRLEQQIAGSLLAEASKQATLFKAQLEEITRLVAKG